jgi:general secretion pathway protein G
LVELLVVIAVIGILAAITLNISSGARERAARDRAQAELAVLATSLERYRAAHGAYPHSPVNGRELLDALSGRLTPTGVADNRRPFITLAGLTLDDEQIQLIDPWGNPYIYQRYRSGVREGFFLYSAGPDGADDISDETADVNLDNVRLTP